jgi:hypothetical protein
MKECEGRQNLDREPEMAGCGLSSRLTPGMPFTVCSRCAPFAPASKRGFRRSYERNQMTWPVGHARTRTLIRVMEVGPVLRLSA